MASSTDVPGKFDVVVNSQGYMFSEVEDVRAQYGYSPTFLERQNVGADYGDDQQDFFLTGSQTDWSLGEERRFNSDLSDADLSRQYFTGTSVDPVTVPGQVSMRYTMASLSFGEAVIAACANTVSGTVFCVGATHLYEVSSNGTVTDRGTHGLGASNTVTRFSAGFDGKNLIIGSDAAGSTPVGRLWNGSAFSDYYRSNSPGAADFWPSTFDMIGNTAYTYDEAQGILESKNGTQAAQIYSWVDGSATALTGSSYRSKVAANGGSLIILRTKGRRSVELWQYDGTSTFQIAEFPGNFTANDMIVVGGIVYVSGYLSRSNDKLPAIYYFLNGSLGQLWVSKTAGFTGTTGPGIAPWNGGIAFTDDSKGKLCWYDLTTGGVHTLGSYTVSGSQPILAATADFLVHIRNSTTGWYYPTSTLASTTTVTSSLWDFGNSLTKQFRGVKVDFDTASGASVDIAYRTGDVDGSYTTLQTGATSGTEYTMTGVSGTSISTKITLNKGSSAGPVLKKVYVRAAPQLSQYRQFTYVLDCTGRNGPSNIRLRNGAPQPLDGQSMANNLVTAITSTSPISITDRFGTFNAFLEPSKCELREIRPEEYIAVISGRQV